MKSREYSIAFLVSSDDNILPKPVKNEQFPMIIGPTNLINGLKCVSDLVVSYRRHSWDWSHVIDKVHLRVKSRIQVLKRQDLYGVAYGRFLDISNVPFKKAGIF